MQKSSHWSLFDRVYVRLNVHSCIRHFSLEMHLHIPVASSGSPWIRPSIVSKSSCSELGVLLVLYLMPNLRNTAFLTVSREVLFLPLPAQLSCSFWEGAALSFLPTYSNSQDHTCKGCELYLTAPRLRKKWLTLCTVSYRKGVCRASGRQLEPRSKGCTHTHPPAPSLFPAAFPQPSHRAGSVGMAAPSHISCKHAGYFP